MTTTHRLILLAFFALAWLTGCTTEQATAFAAGADAFGRAARTGLEVRDRYEHPELYRVQP